jgi:hypothetical protein
MIVGLAGFKGSGKDTVAAYLVKQHGFERKAFADPMKQSIAALFGISFADVDRYKNDESIIVELKQSRWNKEFEGVTDHDNLGSMDFRSFLQRYGTEAHRDVFGQDFWLEYTLPSNGYYHGRNIVVTDVRYSNEAKRVRDFGGSIWFINRITNKQTSDPHSSETLDFGTDVTVPNSSTIEDLYARIEEALNVSVG